MSLIFARTGRDMICVTPAAARIENGPVPVSCRARGVLTLDGTDPGTEGVRKLRDQCEKRFWLSARRLPRGLTLRRVQSTGGRSDG
jgi:hypothetical protein